MPQWVRVGIIGLGDNTKNAPDFNPLDQKHASLPDKVSFTEKSTESSED
jgi:hypothetical protein